MRKIQLDESKLVEMYENGDSTIKIAKVFNCAVGTINKRLKKLGVKMKSNKEYRTKYSFDHNFFETIDTEEKAYWLGFMYADGNVRKNRNQSVIQIKVNDQEIIEKFIKSINGNMSVSHYINWVGKTISAIHLTSDKMFNDLIKQGCIPNKSLVLTFPNKYQIPENLINHFIRGYFDGDGSINYGIREKYSIRKKQNIKRLNVNAQFIGTKEMLTVINNCVNFNGLEKEKRHDSNTWYIRTNSLSNIKSFYEYLYSNATIYLSRKKQKFEEIFSFTDAQRL